MPKVMIAVDGLFEVHGRYVEMLREAGFEVVYAPKPVLSSEEETIKAFQGVSATIAGGEPYSERVLRSLTELRVISRWGVGVDRIDLQAATRQKIAVAITPTANHEAVAEHTVTMLLALTRFLVQRDYQVRQGLWERYPSLSLRGKKLGLVGLGRIGRSVAVRVAAFRPEILACESFPDQDFLQAYEIKLLDLETLLSQSDFVSLHIPLTEETRGLMNRDTLSCMKRGSFLINTARGELVVEEDLMALLESGHIAGCALDVFEQEPHGKNYPLLKFDNVIMTPHTAGVDEQSIEDMAVEAAENIINLYRDTWPRGSVVNSDLRPHWKW